MHHNIASYVAFGSAMVFLTVCNSARAQIPQCSSEVGGPVTLLKPEPPPEVVYPYDADGCGPNDYSDNPARPILAGVDHKLQVLWFASGSRGTPTPTPGYLKGVGTPVGQNGAKDILARMHRVKDASGNCETYISNGDTTNPVESYNNRMWFQTPWSGDDGNIYGLVHNEFRSSPGAGNNFYAAIVGASSQDGAATPFHMFTAPNTPAGSNTPVIAPPLPYPPGNHAAVGMTANSNIIRWGRYYYVLVARQMKSIDPALANGTCIYRTDNIRDFRSWMGWGGSGYTVPTVSAYPNNLPDPSSYLCTPVLPGASGSFAWSWSYNTVLHKFIILGTDNNFVLNGKVIRAFVYVLAALNPGTGVLSPDLAPNGHAKVYFLQKWTPFSAANATAAGEAYPSLLDPWDGKDRSRKAFEADSTESGPNHLSAPDSPETWPHPDGRNQASGRIDRNFQYSGARPYLYYTRMNPKAGANLHGNDRDLVRIPLKVTNCK